MMDRLHWLIHLRDFDAYQELLELERTDADFRALGERQFVAERKGGGTWGCLRARHHRGHRAAAVPAPPGRVRAWLFAGQGAQRVGMGQGLFDRFPEYVAAADRVLGESVRDLCLDDPDGRLNRTRWTQPALYVVNALACAQALAEGPAPDVLAGHSLGEYNALLAAGCFDFETGLRIVCRRGELSG
ncbi:hypothetical protein SVIOM342S_01733 [Streptomyces violaceorubidus]